MSDADNKIEDEKEENVNDSCSPDDTDPPPNDSDDWVSPPDEAEPDEGSEDADADADDDAAAAAAAAAVADAGVDWGVLLQSDQYEDGGKRGPTKSHAWAECYRIAKDVWSQEELVLLERLMRTFYAWKPEEEEEEEGEETTATATTTTDDDDAGEEVNYDRFSRLVEKEFVEKLNRDAVPYHEQVRAEQLGRTESVVAFLRQKLKEREDENGAEPEDDSLYEDYESDEEGDPREMREFGGRWRKKQLRDLARNFRSVFGEDLMQKIGFSRSIHGFSISMEASDKAADLSMGDAKVYRMTRKWKFPIGDARHIIVPEMQTFVEIQYVTFPDGEEADAVDEQKEEEGESRPQEEQPRELMMEIELVVVDTDYPHVHRECQIADDRVSLGNQIRELLGMEIVPSPKADPKVKWEETETFDPIDGGDVYVRKVAPVQMQEEQEEPVPTLAVIVRLPQWRLAGFDKYPKYKKLLDNPNWHLVLRIPSPPVMTVTRCQSLQGFFSPSCSPEVTDDILRDCLQMVKLEHQHAYEETIEDFPLLSMIVDTNIDFSSLYRPWTRPQDSPLPKTILSRSVAEFEMEEGEEAGVFTEILLPETHNSTDGSGTLAFVFSFLPIRDILCSMFYVSMDFSKASHFALVSRTFSEDDMVDLLQCWPLPKQMDLRLLSHKLSHVKVTGRSIVGPLGESLLRRLVFENVEGFRFDVKAPFPKKEYDIFGRIMGGDRWGDPEVSVEGEEGNRFGRHWRRGYEDSSSDLDDADIDALPDFDLWGTKEVEKRRKKALARKRRIPLSIPLPCYFVLRGFKDRSLLLRLIEKTPNVTEWAELVLMRCPLDMQVVRAVFSRLRAGVFGIPHSIVKILCCDGSIQAVRLLAQCIPFSDIVGGAYLDMIHDACCCGNLEVLKFLWAHRPASVTAFPGRSARRGVLHVPVLKFIIEECGFVVDHSFADDFVEALTDNSGLFGEEVVGESLCIVLSQPGVDLLKLAFWDLPHGCRAALMKSPEIPIQFRFLAALATPSVDSEAALLLYKALDTRVANEIAANCVVLSALRPGFRDVLEALLDDSRIRFRVNENVLTYVARNLPIKIKKEERSWDTNDLRDHFGILKGARMGRDPWVVSTILRDPTIFSRLLSSLGRTRFVKTKLLLDAATTTSISSDDVSTILFWSSPDGKRGKEIVSSMCNYRTLELAQEAFSRFGGEISTTINDSSDSIWELVRTLLRSKIRKTSHVLLKTVMQASLPTDLSVESFRGEVLRTFTRLLLAFFEKGDEEIWLSFMEHFENPSALFEQDDRVLEFINEFVQEFRYADHPFSRGMKMLLNTTVDPSRPKCAEFFLKILTHVRTDSSHIELLLQDPRFKIGRTSGVASSDDIARSFALALERKGKKESKAAKLGAAQARVLALLLANSDFDIRSRVLLFQSAVSVEPCRLLLADPIVRKRASSADALGLLIRCFERNHETVKLIITEMDDGRFDSTGVDPRALFKILSTQSLDLLRFVLSKKNFLRSIGGIPPAVISRLRAGPARGVKKPKKKRWRRKKSKKKDVGDWIRTQCCAELLAREENPSEVAAEMDLLLSSRAHRGALKQRVGDYGSFDTGGTCCGSCSGFGDRLTAIESRLTGIEGLLRELLRRKKKKSSSSSSSESSSDSSTESDDDEEDEGEE